MTNNRPLHLPKKTTAPNAPKTSDATLVPSRVEFRLTLIPFDYKLEDAGEGWNNGSVMIAFENKTGEFLADQSLSDFNATTTKPDFPIGEILLETKEGATYPVDFSMITLSTITGDRPQIKLDNLHIIAKGIPPNFRFYYQGGLGYGLAWRSAKAATPKRINFVNHPDLSFDLPSSTGNTIVFPYDTQPSSTVPISSLGGLELVNDPKGITGVFTGKCVYLQRFGENYDYYLEVQVSNSDKFQEHTSSFTFPISAFSENGAHHVEDNLGFVELIGGQSFSPNAGMITAGPDQNKSLYLLIPEFYNSGKISALVTWSGNKYSIYNMSDCAIGTQTYTGPTARPTRTAKVEPTVAKKPTEAPAPTTAPMPTMAPKLNSPAQP